MAATKSSVPGFGTIPRSSYSTPQQLTVLQFDQYADRSDALRQELRTGAKAVEAKQAKVKAERDSQRLLQKKQMEFEQGLYATVGELPQTGIENFDTNKTHFFNDLMDKYINIKNAIDNDPNYDKQKGMRALAAINGQVKAYKTAAPQVLAQAKLLREAMQIPYGEPGSLSALNITSQQKVLLGLLDNEDVRLVDRNGQLILFQPPNKDNPEGGMINVNELLNLEASGIKYIQKVPDISETLNVAFDGVVGNKENGFNWSQDDNTFMTIKTHKTEGGTITTRSMSEEQRENIANAMLTSKVLDPILDNEQYRNSIWVDMMEEYSSFDINNEEDVKKMKDFLVNKSIDDNAKQAGIETITGVEKLKETKYTRPAKQISTTTIRNKVSNMAEALKNKDAGALKRFVGQIGGKAVGKVELVSGEYKFFIKEDGKLVDSGISVKEGNYNDLVNLIKNTLGNDAGGKNYKNIEKAMERLGY